MKVMKIISFLGNIKFARWLLFLLSMDLFIGSIVYHYRSEVFVPLNTKSLWDWLQTYGQNNLEVTWWFYLFIVVMFMLGANTFFCTIERTWLILTRYKKMKGERTLILILSPHIMHLSFIILLLGYFFLYSFGINSYNNIIKPGFPVTIKGTEMQINFLKFKAEPYKSKLYSGLNKKYIDPQVALTIQSGCTAVRKVLSINSPIYHKGYSIHMEAFNPKSNRSMTNETWVNLTIRKNAGIPMFIMGVVLFLVGTALYVVLNFKNRNSGGKS